MPNAKMQDLILERGAVQDTYNLLAVGIRLLLCTLARVQDKDLATWAGGNSQELGFGCFCLFSDPTNMVV